MKQQATVMVVDDDSLNLSLMEDMLAPEGYHVVLCNSGKGCLEAVRNHPPDVILLDAMMPDLDGFQVVRRLKSDDATRLIPVVMVTSLSDMSDRVEAMDAGADDFLSKPVAKIELLARVRSLVKVKTSNDQLVESEKRYREVVQDASAIIFTLNGQGKITFMNNFGLSFFGYTAGEIIGKAEFETILPEYESTGRNLKKVSEDIRAIAHPYQHYTHENITKSHRRVWVNWTTRSVVDRATGETGMICVGVDVTASRRAEHERLRQHARYKRRDILDGGIQRRLSQGEMLGELKQMGVVLEPPFIVSLLSIPSEYLPATGSTSPEQMERQHRIDLLVDYFQSAEIGVAWQTPVGIAIIQAVADKKLRPLSVGNAKLAARTMMNIVSRYWTEKKIVVGVTHSTDEVQDLASLFEQSRSALQFGPAIMSGETVYHWQDLGYFQFVVKDLQSTQVKQFIQQHLGPILSQKNAGNIADDLATLEAVFSGDAQQVIADRLHVHKQTIVFRKKKLEDTLGVDLDVLETRLNLVVAMKLLSLSS